MREPKKGDVCILRQKRSMQSNVHSWNMRIFPANTIFEVCEGPNLYGVCLVRPYDDVGKERFTTYFKALKRLGWLELLATTGLGLDPDLVSQTANPGSDLTEHDG